MKTVFVAFAVLCVFFSAVNAAPETTVQEDYIWQERFKERLDAAEAGNAEAQFNVGEMFEKGSGVPIDLKRAFGWYERAAKQQHQKARFKLAYMYYRGEGTASNPGKAFQLMEKLAKGGYVRAQYYLGLMYETGTVTSRSIDQAYTWYRRAAKGGYAPAADAIADLAKLTPDLEPFDSAYNSRSRENAKPAAAPAPKPAASKPSFAAVKPPVSNPLPAAPLPAAEAAPPVDALLGEAARGSQINPRVEIGSPAPPLNSPDPPPTATVASVTPAIQMLPATHSLLANGNWMSQSNLPVEFLPSKVTNCERSSTADLECLSKEIVSNIANAEIVYQTHSTVTGIQPSGEFKVRYRNNVVKILRDLAPGDSDDPSQTGMGISLGWQVTEHHLECKLENSQTVHCVKNQTQKLTIMNQTAL